MTKALVLGGCGFMGSSTARDLSKADGVTEVVLGDIRPDMSRVHASVRNNPKISAQFMDITGDFQALVRTVRGFDLVINCVGPYSQFGTIVPRAAIAAGVNYLDICDDASMTRQFFELDDAARKAGVCILTGAGCTPGTTNMLARWAADQMDAVDEIEVFFAIALLDPIGRAGLTQAMGQFLGNVTQFLDGRSVEVAGGTGAQEATFLDPFGKAQVYYARHPEPFTLPRYIPGVKKVIDKATFWPPRVVKLFGDLIDLGLYTNEPVKCESADVSPRDFIVTFLQRHPNLRSQPGITASLACTVTARGRRERTRVSYTCRSVGWGGPMVAIPASIGAQMLLGREIEAKGVVAPEGAIDPRRYFARMATKGLHVFEEKTEERNLVLD